MKKIIRTFLILFILMISPASYAGINLWADGKYLTTDSEPVMSNGRTLVPVRVIAEQMGYNVKWDDATKTITISESQGGIGRNIKLGLGDKSAYLSNPDETFELEVAPMIINGRTMVPVRFIAERFGKKVAWDNATKTVVIGEGYIGLPKNFQIAKVISVVDGDTIKVDIKGMPYKLRLIGVNTPETKHPNKGVEFYGKEASNYTTKQLTGKEVYLQKDVSETDKYGRLLRYVWIAPPSMEEPSKEEVINKQFNAILVKEGYANASNYPPDVKYSEIYRELEITARNSKLGLWSEAEVINPQPASPDSYQVIGNSNTKKYHNLGCRAIETIKPEHIVHFKNEEEAIQAGYKPCQICH